MSNCGYFWDGEKVIQMSGQPNVGDVRKAGLEDFYCVDISPGCESPSQRYGMFKRNDGWNHYSFDQFPREFRMHLLLLGVA